MLKQQGASKLDKSLVSLLSTEAPDTLKNTDCSVLFPSQGMYLILFINPIFGPQAVLKLKLGAVLWWEQVWKTHDTMLSRYAAHNQSQFCIILHKKNVVSQ